MIKLYNRKTKQYEIEKVAGEGILKALYGNVIGKMGLEVLVKRKFYSYLTGVLCDIKFSSKKIASFIKDFNIDMSTSTSKLEDFKNFNEFFTRKLISEARPFELKDELLLSPGDGRLKAWEDIDLNNVIQIKGFCYSLKELLLNEDLANTYEGGTCVLLRLAPVDYHRFHFIDEGKCSQSVKLKGQYYSVNPIALNTVSKVFCKNKREYSVQTSKNFGDILYVEVGATSVGSIVQTYKTNTQILRGDEKGYFKFGGSTIILFFKKDTVKIDNEIIEYTNLDIETRVLAGEIIGKKG